MYRGGSRDWMFRGVVSGLNLLLVGMLFTITIPPPVLAVPVVKSMSMPAMTHLDPVIRQGVPTHITIDSLAIDLDIGEGIYDSATASWAIDDSRAYYAALSVPSNDHNGTTFIYGHARSPVFARLPELQVGAEAVVSTSSGYTFHYRYESMQQVLPSDMSVIRPDGNPTLVLQTCMGAWDVYRGLFSFTLVSVQGV